LKKVPDENSPPADQTGITEPKGVTIVGRQGKGVVIIDKASQTAEPQIEITQGEGDRE
jgi:hypothetical protein